MGRSASTDLSMGNGGYAILNAVEDTSHIKRGHIFQSRIQIRQEQGAGENAIVDRFYDCRFGLLVTFACPLSAIWVRGGNGRHNGL